MLLETLFLSPCFLSGETTHRDSQTTLSINKKDLENDETLLFFDIDDQTEHHCDISDENNHRRKLRELFWQQQDGHSLCDLLVFFAKGNERIFCFVELKDNKSDFPKATEQVISTYDAFKKKLATSFQSKYIAKAFICCSRGSLPQEYKNSLAELNKKFSDCVHDGKSENFLDFLRGENVKFKKSGQKKKKK
jgi:hypothetical protein